MCDSIHLSPVYGCSSTDVGVFELVQNMLKNGAELLLYPAPLKEMWGSTAQESPPRSR